jgi:hypothetical protein
MSEESDDCLPFSLEQSKRYDTPYFHIPSLQPLPTPWSCCRSDTHVNAAQLRISRDISGCHSQVVILGEFVFLKWKDGGIEAWQIIGNVQVVEAFVQHRTDWKC